MWYAFTENRPAKDYHELDGAKPDPVEITDDVIRALQSLENRLLREQAESDRLRATKGETHEEDTQS